MWLVFAILSMLAFAATDIFGKRRINAGNALTSFELTLSSGVLALAASVVLFACGVGESGRAPWTILAEEPLILVCSFCHVAYLVFCLFSLRYVGLSVDAVIGGMDGIVFLVGITIVHLLTGRLEAVRELLRPARFVPILVALVGVFLLPRLDSSRESRRRTVVGILFMFLALVLDGGGESLITAVVFDRGQIGPVDYMIASWFGVLPTVVILMTGVWLKTGRWCVPFRRGTGSLGYAVLALVSSMTYLYAASHDAVRTGVVFIAGPIFTLLGAKVMLKERYSVRQYLCIWTVLLAAIAFCVADRFL